MLNQYIENPTEALKIQKAIGIRIAPHLHTTAELIYIEEGSATLTVGSLEYLIQKGDFAYIMPSTLHSVIPDSYQTSVFVIDCKTDLIETVMKKFKGCRPASPVLRSHDVPRDLPYALTALSTEENDDIAISWLNLIFMFVCCNLRFANITDGATADLSSRILSYLGGHYREPLSLNDLANAMGVSRFHLSHMFATKFGIGFKEYLNNLRVECAKGLLRSTDMPISEVSAQAGFENQRTFNRVFGDSTGITPRDYRYGKSENIKKGKGKIRPIIQTPATRAADKPASAETKPTATRVVTIEKETMANTTLIAATPENFEKVTGEKLVTKKSKAANTKTAKAKPATAPKEKPLPNSPLDRNQQNTNTAKKPKTAVWLL